MSEPTIPPAPERYLLDTDRGHALWWRGGYAVVNLADVAAIEHVLPMLGGWRAYVYLKGGQRLRAVKNGETQRLCLDLCMRDRWPSAATPSPVQADGS